MRVSKIVKEQEIVKKWWCRFDTEFQLLVEIYNWNQKRNGWLKGRLDIAEEIPGKLDNTSEEIIKNAITNVLVISLF